jgi:uncharacterized protein (DUF433 family)
MDDSDRGLLDRITTSPGVLGGKPVIRGTRLSVEYILELLQSGETPAAICEEYAGVHPLDIAACVAFERKTPAAVAGQ